MKLNKQLLCKLLLTTGITLCTACTQEKEIDWYQEYTNSPIEELDIQVMDENPFYQDQPQEEQITYLQQLIMNNPTMSELQKYWTLDYQSLLLKLIHYNPDFIFDAFNHLQIATVDFKNPNLQGLYYHDLLLLDQDLNDYEVATFKHEIAHVFSKRIYYKNEPLYSFEEGLASILSDEYGNVFNSSYRDTATVLKMLIEVVGTEPFYQIITTGSIDSLKEALIQIDPDIDIEQLISDIDTVYQDGGLMEYHTTHVLKYSYIPTIQNLYEKKFQTNMYENAAMNSYIHFLNRSTIEINDQIYYTYLDHCYFNTDGYPCIVLYDEDFNYYNSYTFNDWENITTYQKTLLP